MNERAQRAAVLGRLKRVCVVARAIIAVVLVLTAVAVVDAVLALLGAGGREPLVEASVPGVAEGAAMALMTWAALIVGQRVLGRVARTGEPFRVENARELRLSSYLVVATGVVPGLVGMVAAFVVKTGFDGMADLTVVLLGVVLVCVSKAFEYGCILQTLDDETL